MYTAKEIIKKLEAKGYKLNIKTLEKWIEQDVAKLGLSIENLAKENILDIKNSSSPILKRKRFSEGLEPYCIQIMKKKGRGYGLTEAIEQLDQERELFLSKLQRKYEYYVHDKHSIDTSPQTYAKKYRGATEKELTFVFWRDIFHRSRKILEYYKGEWMYRMELLHTVRSHKNFVLKVREAIENEEVEVKKTSDKKAFESFASMVRGAGVQAGEISYTLVCYRKAGKEMETLSEQMIFSESPNGFYDFFKEMEKEDKEIKISWKNPKKI